MFSNIKYLFPCILYIAFCGNPLIVSSSYAKQLLVIYLLYLIIFIKSRYRNFNIANILKTLAPIILFILIINFLQLIRFGVISYPGTFAIFVKISITILVVSYYIYYKKIDFIDVYIKSMVIIVLISFPFWILNHFTQFSLSYPVDGGLAPTLVFYTPSELGSSNSPILRNNGMFWEPGAFAGYINIAIIFILLNYSISKRFNYSFELIILILGMITTQSTSGYINLFLLLTIYCLKYRKYIIFLPILAIGIMALSNLDFLGEKIQDQWENSDIFDSSTGLNNTRIGSLQMDYGYIVSEPISGSGLDPRTRYWKDPEIYFDVGNGNGFSGFIAIWGIPLFLFWIYRLSQFLYLFLRSKFYTFLMAIMFILILQGEAFLNYPLFLGFFIMYQLYSKLFENYDNKLLFIKV